MLHKWGISKFQIITVLVAAAICFAMAYSSKQSRNQSRDETYSSIASDRTDVVTGEETQTGDDGAWQAEETAKEAGSGSRQTGIAASDSSVQTVEQSGQTAPVTEQNGVGTPVNVTSSYLFYYEMLTEDEKQIYGEIYESITTRQEKKLSTCDKELVDKLFEFVLWDHPEIFYTNGYNLLQQLLGEQVISMTLQPVFQMTEAEVANKQAFIASYVETFRTALPQGLDTYGKIKFVYEYLINGTEYQIGCENSQNICSVFILRKSVCAGYAKATQYLLRELGIPATVVHGTANGEGHAWNLVWVDGIPYYLDTTWGDASYSYTPPASDVSDAGDMTGDAAGSRVPPVNYDYFLITEHELLTTHSIDHPEYYPAVTDTRFNYFRHEGLYFENYDTEKLRGIFDRAYETGQQNVTIRCAGRDLLLAMQSSLLTEQKIFDYVKVMDRFYYNINESMCTMTFWLE